MKVSYFLTFALVFFTLFACENENEADDDQAVATETNELNASNNADVDLDDLWDEEKSADFVRENSRTQLRIQEIAKAGQAANLPQEIAPLTNMALQTSQSAYSNLSQMASQMSLTLSDKLSEDELDELDLDEFGDGEEDDLGEDYLEALMKEYKDAIDDYEDAAEKGSTKALRTHAQSMLTKLQNDLQKIEALEEEID